MGPNGSGKSTLSKAIGGHPDYTVTSGDVCSMARTLALEPDERARRGLFLAFQYPMEIPGVSNANFLRAALNARQPEGEEIEATDFYAASLRGDGQAGDAPRIHGALGQRRLLRRRKKAQRNPPDGHAQAEVCHSRRDRFRARYRCLEDRERGRECAARTGDPASS